VTHDAIFTLVTIDLRMLCSEKSVDDFSTFIFSYELLFWYENEIDVGKKFQTSLCSS